MMDISHILDSLNDKQREAVTSNAQHLLVLAGAGSGKTRVLVHRIAWLENIEQVPAHGILAVTFTNKAAASMRGRVETLLQAGAHGMWMGTFHSIAHRLLRYHWREANLQENFQILDADDQLSLLKRVIRDMNLDEGYFVPRKIQNWINGQKDDAVRASQVQLAGDPYSQTLVRVYQTYEDICFASSAVDFNELLLRVYEMWQQHPTMLEHYQRRFSHVLVDEFQDTNRLQYAWLRQLGGPGNYITIVGDDDQSIYGWRGACVENIQHFLTDFPDTQTIRLEQNYRSTQIILDAANAVIANNRGRLGKALWTEARSGELIEVYTAFNEIDEARYLVAKIQQWIAQGNCREEVAVLYRSNAQSRVLEEAFMQAGIPYRVYGGFRFFERAEIKDALAYLRLVHFEHDDTAFERVINVPARSVGERSVMLLRDIARQQACSLWQAAQYIIQDTTTNGRLRSSLSAFTQLIQNMKEAVALLSLHEQVEHVIEKSGLNYYYAQEKGEKARARLENLAELISAARQFTPEHPNDISPLAEFLSHAALEAGERGDGKDKDCVQMMTLHSAKGLEFPYVFISGVEEGLFPHPMSVEEAHQLEEERRLFYVGITRAQQRLCVTYAEVRRIHGHEQYHRRSRFIDEIPEECLQSVRLRSVVQKPKLKDFYDEFDQTTSHGLHMGQRVRHAKFGEGVVLNYEGHGTHARIQVRFHNNGTKWLIESYAQLQTID